MFLGAIGWRWCLTMIVLTYLAITRQGPFGLHPLERFNEVTFNAALLKSVGESIGVPLPGGSHGIGLVRSVDFEPWFVARIQAPKERLATLAEAMASHKYVGASYGIPVWTNAPWWDLSLKNVVASNSYDFKGSAVSIWVAEDKGDLVMYIYHQIM
ncbi:MAG TPA: hypothetical protein VF607_16885 [Verrucomicrobiae bacterium]